MSELMLREQFEQSAREFAEQGRSPDEGPFKDQSRKHEMWLSFYHRHMHKLETQKKAA